MLCHCSENADARAPGYSFAGSAEESEAVCRQDTYCQLHSLIGSKFKYTLKATTLYVLQNCAASSRLKEHADDDYGMDDDEDCCVICLDNPREIVFLHCGHMVRPASWQFVMDFQGPLCF